MPRERQEQGAPAGKHTVALTPGVRVIQNGHS